MLGHHTTHGTRHLVVQAAFLAVDRVVLIALLTPRCLVGAHRLRRIDMTRAHAVR